MPLVGHSDTSSSSLRNLWSQSNDHESTLSKRKNRRSVHTSQSGRLMGSAAVHAQEATGAAAAFDEVSASGAEMAGYAWPVVASITAALIGIKLFKKFANRAS